MSPFKKVLLIGASGALGSPVLQAFISDGSFQITILSRKESKSVFPEGIKVLKADYTSMSELQNAMEGQDVVISMIELASMNSQRILVDAAIAAGVKRFLPSEFGPPSRDPRFMDIYPDIVPPKARLVDYLKTKESEISWTAIITGAFFDWALKNTMMGMDFKNKIATLIDEGSTMFTSCELDHIGKGVIACLNKAEDTKNTYVFLGQFQVNQQDVLKTIEKIQGEKWEVVQVTSEELIAQGKKRIAEGDFYGNLDLTKTVITGKMGLGDSSKWGDMWDEKLGLEVGDLETAVKSVITEL